MTIKHLMQALLALSTTFSVAYSAYIPAHAARQDQAYNQSYSQSYNQSPAWPQALLSQAHDQSWPDFAAKTQRWSTYEAPTFNQVFIPQTIDDLSAGLKYLSSNNLKFLAKSGGHGYSPTLGTVQNAVQINMENFKYVRVNPDNTATVGTGTLFGELVDALYNAKREITVGSCPCVGATGAMLGGGLGRLQGLHGMNSDALKSVKIALYNGTILEASERQNADLFWGIRGAGQNFGIVIESTFETYEQTNNGQIYNADLYFDKKEMSNVINIVNRLAHPEMDPLLNLIPFIAYNSTTNRSEVIVNMQFSGPKRDAQKYTRQFARYATHYNEVETSWGGSFNAAVGGLINFSCIKGNKYNMRGVITKTLSSKHLTDYANDLERLVRANPPANMTMMMIETFASKAVEERPDNFSAFPHRKHFANMVELVSTFTGEDDGPVGQAVDAFSKKWRDTFGNPRVSGYDRLYVYQNYAHDDEPLKAIYGYDDWRHRKLTNLKNAYDPKGFFNGYHAIPSKMSDWNKVFN